MKLYIALPIDINSIDIRLSTNEDILRKDLPECQHYIYEIGLKNDIYLDKDIIHASYVKIVKL